MGGDAQCTIYKRGWISLRKKVVFELFGKNISFRSILKLELGYLFDFKGYAKKEKKYPTSSK